MAKEMMIVFVYDTAKCRKEEDDLDQAVIYFHPAWVSLTQRLALAGQLMGVHFFLATSFSSPRFITLQGGKFVLKKFGQYVLAVGTDRNIQDWILERRADTLESLLKLFHCDLAKILESLNNDQNRFSEKLYQMFETYLPILQYNANLFSNISIIKFPKSASNIYLEAIQMLQHYQSINGILGGALFYNNKIVATQLGADLTKQIVVTDPYRIKAPAERIFTKFHLPVGVQLLQVYIEQKLFAKLLHEANNERYYNSLDIAMMKKTLQRKNIFKGAKESFTSGMKRDTSRIFTVPEEAELDHMTDKETSQYISPIPYASYNSPIKRKQEAKSDRPKYSINSVTPSVCSTPLKDVNKILHETSMLICSSVEDTEKDAGNENESSKENNDIPDVVKEALRCKRLNKLKNSTPKEILIKKRNLGKKSISVPDLTSSINSSMNNNSARTCRLGLPKLNDFSDDSPLKEFTRSKQHFHTITDPYYPVFRNDGLLISQSLYEEYVASRYEELRSDNVSMNHHDNLLCNISNVTSTKSSTDSALKSVTRDISESTSHSYDKRKQETYKRSMSLPLKPLNIVDNDDRRKSASECGNPYDFLQKRKLDGLQLTPLMSKLSLLADERTSGFCSRETTPGEFRDLSSFSMMNHLIKQKLETVNKETSDGEDELDEDWVTPSKNENSLEKTELFLCGYQNMVLVLLMENGTANHSDLIQILWQTCENTLCKFESQLQQCLEPLSSNENKELYSILSVDSEWDTMQRSGLWSVTELDIVSYLHDKFVKSSNLTDIIVRTEDTVVYGNQCGKTEVFYQQAVTPNVPGGLPTPADLMGIVSLKAKRRLERDHGIVML